MPARVPGRQNAPCPEIFAKKAGILASAEQFSGFTLGRPAEQFRESRQKGVESCRTENGNDVIRKIRLVEPGMHDTGQNALPDDLDADGSRCHSLNKERRET